LSIDNSIKSIAIGSFDGLHLAHQTLIDKVEAIVIIERNGGYLTPGYKRSMFTNKTCCFYHFDKIKSLSADSFVLKLKEDFPLLEKIVIGYDFAFGKDKMGNAQHLKKLFNGEVHIVNEVLHKNISIHSRTIKSFLKDGNIRVANELLGREYQIDGKVIKGQGLGKKELVPTINLEVSNYQLPLEGVYATRTHFNGKWMNSVTFLGHRTTTDGTFAVETHILKRDIATVESPVGIKFVDFIRKNQKFDSLDELRKKIAEDMEKAEIILN